MSRPGAKCATQPHRNASCMGNQSGSALAVGISVAVRPRPRVRRRPAHSPSFPATFPKSRLSQAPRWGAAGDHHNGSSILASRATASDHAAPPRRPTRRDVPAPSARCVTRLKAYVVVHINQGNAAPVTLSLLQATAVAGAGSKALLNTTPIWCNANTGASDSYVKQTAAMSFTTDVGTNDKIVIFEIQPEVLSGRGQLLQQHCGRDQRIQRCQHHRGDLDVPRRDPGRHTAEQLHRHLRGRNATPNPRLPDTRHRFT